jgi:hypothetical protein
VCQCTSCWGALDRLIHLLKNLVTGAVKSSGDRSTVHCFGKRDTVSIDKRYSLTSMESGIWSCAFDIIQRHHGKA